MISTVTGNELQHFSLLEIQMFSWCVHHELSCNRDWTATFQPITDTIPSCVSHFPAFLLSPYFPLIILPPGFFSHYVYFLHLLLFPYSLPHFHPVVQFWMSLILNCGPVSVNPEAFHEFLELSRWIPRQYLEICCHYFLLIVHYLLTERYITFAIKKHSWPCTHHVSVPWKWVVGFPCWLL